MQTKNLLDGKSTKPSHRGEVYEYIKEKPEDRECKTHTVVITLAKELRDGENLAFEHNREQELANYNKCYGCHHLIGCNGDTVAESCS